MPSWTACSCNSKTLFITDETGRARFWFFAREPRTDCTFWTFLTRLLSVLRVVFTRETRFGLRICHPWAVHSLRTSQTLSRRTVVTRGARSRALRCDGTWLTHVARVTLLRSGEVVCNTCAGHNSSGAIHTERAWQRSFRDGEVGKITCPSSFETVVSWWTVFLGKC